MWDLESGKSLRVLEGHTGSVSSVWVTADGRRAVSSSDTTLRVWDLESGESLCILVGQKEALTVTADGCRAISICDTMLMVWDLERGKVIATFIADAALTTFAIGPHEPTVIAGDESGQVHFLGLIEGGNDKNTPPTLPPKTPISLVARIFQLIFGKLGTRFTTKL